MKKIVAKIISLALCVGLVGGIVINTNKPVNADPVAPCELGSVITLGDGYGTRNIATSSFEAVNITVLHQSDVAGGEQYVYYELALQHLDFSEASSLHIQIGNSMWGPVSVNFMLGDTAGRVVRVIKNWNSQEANQAAGLAKQTFHATLGGAETASSHTGYGFQNIPGPYAGYMQIQLSDYEYEWGAADFDYKNVNKILVGLDAKYNEYTKINIGNIYIQKGENFVQVYDVTKAVEGFGAPNNYGKWGAPAGSHNDHVVATKLKANEIKTTQRFLTNNNQWSAFYVLMPMDLRAYNGISYHVDNSMNSTTVFFNKFMREYQGGRTTEEWYCDGGFATYIPDDGSASFIGDTNTIPAGFKGTIVVPFTNFALPSWFTPVNGVLELESIWWNFGFTFDVSQGERSFLIKDFKLVADAREFLRLPQETTWYGDTKVVLPMEYNDDFDLNSDWVTSWDKASTATLELVDSPANDVVGAGGKALKFTCGSMKSVADASNETAVEHYPQGEQRNIAGAKGLTYYVKNTSASQIGFNLGFDLLVAENTQQRWKPKMNARYTLVDVNTGVEVVRNGKNGIYVPAGFEGWVRIDFAQFDNPTWETNGTAFSDQFPVAYMVFNVNAQLHESESFIIDSIGYYYTETSISTMFAQSQYGILDAMNSNYNG